jgi:PEP-CTERM/exosortase A-associated glycosyltransferase
MKVLHVLDHSLPELSGYSTRSFSIVSFQRLLGLDPVVLTTPKHPRPGPEREEIGGIVHHRTAASTGRAGRLPYIGEVAQMARMAGRIAAVAREEKAGIIHAHSPVLNGLPALWAGRRLGLPVIYEARAFWEDAAVDHGTTREGSARYRLTRALETLMFKRADRVVVIAAGMRAELTRRGVDPARVTIVPNGVDTERFSPMERDEPLARSLGLNGAPLLGFIGSFYHYEGLRFLVEAMPDLRQRLPGARVLLVGGGEEDAALRASAGATDGAVVFTGQIPYEHIRRYYSLLDVFVCPRKRMRLTELVTPLKPLEAMAMGKAVLGSDVGGIAELVQHDVTGMLFAAESREGLVTAAAQLGGNPDLRARLGQRARQCMVDERSWRAVASKYLPIYRAVSGHVVS